MLLNTVTTLSVRLFVTKLVNTISNESTLMPRDTSGPRETINFGLKVTRDLAKVSFSTPFESSSYSGVIY